MYYLQYERACCVGYTNLSRGCISDRTRTRILESTCDTNGCKRSYSFIVLGEENRTKS